MNWVGTTSKAIFAVHAEQSSRDDLLSDQERGDASDSR